jgi:hypothetical protein
MLVTRGVNARGSSLGRISVPTPLASRDQGDGMNALALRQRSRTAPASLEDRA